MIATDEAVQHYRKHLLISPGFIQLCKGYIKRAYKRRGL